MKINERRKFALLWLCLVAALWIMGETTGWQLRGRDARPAYQNRLVLLGVAAVGVYGILFCNRDSR